MDQTIVLYWVACHSPGVEGLVSGLTELVPGLDGGAGDWVERRKVEWEGGGAKGSNKRDRSGGGGNREERQRAGTGERGGER